VATRKPSDSDANTTAAVLVRRATGTKKVRGEDLISDPGLKKKFREIKRQAETKKT
jgi:hypothetical protein